MLLQQSKEATDQDRKEYSIEFNNYLKAIDQNVYNKEDKANINIDFITLQPTESNLLQATLAVFSVTTTSLSLL